MNADAKWTLVALALFGASAVSCAAAAKPRDGRAIAAPAVPAPAATSAQVRALAPPRVLDAFEDTGAWTTMPASGVLMKLASEPGAKGNALRVDFDFQKGGGYAVIHRALRLDLPANYRFTVRVRGATAPQNLEFKLVDDRGENVWWKNRRDFVFASDWQTVTTRKRQIEFAWGPTGLREPTNIAAIEFAITAGSGGKGTVWFDELTFEELPPPNDAPPAIVARASSQQPAAPSAAVVDADANSAWRPAESDARPWIELDCGLAREFGGLAVDWLVGEHLRDYDVKLSDDGAAWRGVDAVRGGNGGRDWFYLPESEARFVRLEAAGDVPGKAIALAGVTLLPLDVGASVNAFYAGIAKASPRGWYPRGMANEMSFWSVVGTALGKEESFLSTDGAIDLGLGKPSIEPFVFANDRLWTWADVTTEQTLMDGDLPIPTTRWRGAPVELTVTALPYTHQGAQFTRALYTVRNTSAERKDGTLYLAIRPFQVNPPVQFLNWPGGAVALKTISGRVGNVFLNQGAGWIVGTVPQGFGATTFDAGDIVEYLAKDRLPEAATVADSNARASAAQAHAFSLAPGDSIVVALDLMLSRPNERTWSPFPFPPTSELVPYVRSQWRRELGPAEIHLPAGASDLENTLRAQIGWILVNRDSAATQPGSRAYARSWIRDGALTATALLRWGKHEDVRRYLEWFAPHQYADGKVPCCVDWRGSDPVPEHDSHGEFVFLVAEYLRHTGDRATAERMWPHVRAAVAYLDTLRRQRLGGEWDDPKNAEFRGVLPPSISHEGYSAKPMHSYWDDFWALQGYEDALWLARSLRKTADAKWIAASGEEFRAAFTASIAAARAKHEIAYVPGCADLGDFDATSTTIAFSPTESRGVAPASAFEATFEQYWTNFTNRRDGKESWDAFTPYEMRNIGAFVRLGWRERANELTRWFLTQRTPEGWREWAEVVWNAPAQAKYIGDLPHTWVGSDFVRSILDGLAYERDADSSLVLCAGVPREWMDDADGVSVRGLSTAYGTLDYTLKREGDSAVLRIGGALRVPRGGIVVQLPRAGIVPERVTVDGKPATAADGAVVVRRVPSVVRVGR